ncbi:MAG TPA: hypothetical protein VI306_21980 [Pyrinomonadaceae bacterium]
MSNPRFWIPFGLSLFLTLALGLVGAASIGSGVGNYLPVILLFPFAMLLTSFLELHFGYLVALALLQFPVYGAILGKQNVKGHFGRTAIALLLIHGVAVGLVLALARHGSW